MSAPGAPVALWNLLLRQGASAGLEPVGVDAWMLLRTEKGYLHVGADTDGTTVPDDVGWGHVARRQTDFIGKRSLAVAQNARPDRLQLVGLKAVDAAQLLPVGAHVLAAMRHPDRTSEGYVTSSGMSPVLGRGVALAMVHGGRRRIGERVDVLVEGKAVPADISPPAAYDPKGDRLRD